MALSVKHINDDASFLLSFGPEVDDPRTGARIEPFTILLDPWITGPSTILHPKMSVTHQKHQACISSLTELSEPDVVIISQHIPDHCNEATMRQLPPRGTKTLILAEPAAARVIRSWKYFDKDKVQTIPKWEDWSALKDDNIVRIPVKPAVYGGEPGEVTVAFIPQRKDLVGLHSAIGITYRAPRVPIPGTADTIPPRSPIWTPPPSPGSSRPRKSYTNLKSLLTASNTNLPSPKDLAPPTPTSPGVFSLRSVRSASSIPLSISSYFSSSTAATSIPSTPSDTPPSSSFPSASPSPQSPDVLSVLFSPHGISPSSLQGYAFSHLSPLSALPLTLLLHCFDHVSNPWWLGGDILLGAPAGAATSARLGARVWIGAHDGEKEVSGLANGLLKTRKWTREEVVREVEFEVGLEEGGGRDSERTETEVIVLGIGDEVVLDRCGVRPGGRSALKSRREKLHGEKVRNGIYSEKPRVGLRR